MAGLADAGQDVVGGAAQREVDPGCRPSTDVELDSFGLVVGRQTLVADSNTGLSQETKDNALAEPVVRMSERVDWPAFVVHHQLLDCLWW